jgi:DNA-binding MarR family transcriptional regulator
MMANDRPSAAAQASRWMSVLHVRLVEELDRDAAAVGAVPHGWFQVLSALEIAPGNRMRLKDLVGTALLTRAGVSRLMDRIEAEGLIRREPSPIDGRGLEAVLTPAGAAAIGRCRPVYAKTIHRCLGRHLTASRLDEMSVLFREILAANDWLPDARPVSVTVSRRPVGHIGKSKAGRGRTGARHG